VSHGAKKPVVTTPEASTRIAPDTSAPTIMPRRTGATVLATEKTTPQRRWASAPAASKPRNAKAAPRSTTPTRNSVSGTCIATEMTAKARGKPEKRMTTTRISQT
jgi:hypothetical protein